MKENIKKHIESLKGKEATAFTDIPDGYFGAFKSKIINKATQGTATEKQTFHNYKWVLAAAAILLVLAVGSVVVLQNRNPQIIPNEKIAFNGQTTSDSLRKFPTNPDSLPKKTLPLQQVDSILQLEISAEEIILYLIESEEFEF
jgi:hypothetical protein